ncbi:MAG TPA: trypsin-like serine protease [Deltaproteobacteria bacterium]|nr:trypsin-like serine protease [Deltaproteobacteria bacterium]HIJ39482.1 trypsin-like serine protease [Deltaproteobacteria bacterium]
MDRFKDFLANYLTGFLSVLLVLNVIIVLFGLMGIGWKQMLDVPTYLLETFGDVSHYLSRSETSGATGRTGKNVAGVIADANIQLVSSDETFSVAVSKVRPAVVNISCETISVAPAAPGTLLFDDPSSDLSTFGGIGSGFILNPDGYILTCWHVVARASNIMVTPFGYAAKRYPARVVAKNEAVNLALLQISTGYTLPFARLGNSSMMETADSVLAIGSPFGLEQSVTHGIISDMARDLLIDGRTYTGMMQTDVAINRGSSGGPLINLSGEVIGVNMAIYAPTGVYSGVSFALPVNTARAWLDSIVR